MNRAVDYTAFDDVAVQRIVAGRRLGQPSTAADAGEATRRLARLGYSDGQIAARLGYTRRSVLRIRNRLGIAAAMPRGTNGHCRAFDAPNRPPVGGLTP